MEVKNCIANSWKKWGSQMTKAQTILLSVELKAEAWMDVQEAVSQVGHILEQELKNDPHVEYVDCTGKVPEPYTAPMARENIKEVA